MTADVQRIRKARKPHRCEWCWTAIVVGEPYDRYRDFDCGSAFTVQLHPECLTAMRSCIGPHDTWTPGDNPRGGTCGWCGEAGCEACDRSDATSTPQSEPPPPPPT